MIQKAYDLMCKIPESNFYFNCLCGHDFKYRLFGKKLGDNFYKISKYSHVELYSAVAYIVDIVCAENLLKNYKRALCMTDNFEFLLQGGINLYYSEIFSHNYEVTSNIQGNTRVIYKNHKFVLKKDLIYRLKRSFNKHFLNQMLFKQ